MWLQLHTREHPILVNTDNIMAIYPDVRKRGFQVANPKAIIMLQKTTIHLMESYVDVLLRIGVNA